MSILYRLGISTQTTAVLVVRGEDNGVITITVNGSSQTETIATGTHDGIIKVDITGLQAGRSYPFTIADVGGTEYNGTLKTMPSSGFSIVNFSCDDPLSVDYGLSRELDVDCLISSGDSSYFNTANTAVEWGGITGLDGSTDSVAASADTANYLAHHLRHWQKPPFLHVIERIPFGYMPDDHEHPNNNFALDTTGSNEAGVLAFNQGHGFPAGGSFADLQAAEAAAQAAFIPYTYGNDSDTGELYFNFRPNDDVEVFVLDCISYRNIDSAADTNFSVKFMLGTTQREWLTAALAASTSTFKLIVSPKRCYDGSVPNPDGWNSYTKELAEIQTQIASSAVTGVIWLCGDKHNIGLFASEAGVAGAIYDHVSLAASPLSKGNHNTGTWHAYQLLEKGVTGVTPRTTGYNKVVIPPGAAYAQLLIMGTGGDVIARERVLAGTNILQPRSAYEKMAI